MRRSNKPAMTLTTSSTENSTQLPASKTRRILARVVRITLLLILALVVIAFVLLAWFIGWGGRPPVRVEMSNSSAEVHVETLGEYPTTIVHLRLQNRQTHSVVWEIKADTGTPQIWRMGFKPGDNPVLLVSPIAGTYKVVFPIGSDHFRLEKGVDYELSLWKDSDSSPSRVQIRFSR